jgi:hypothetical protein
MATGNSIEGFVYFVLSDAGYYKIGKARNCQQRFMNLQASTTMALRIVHQIASNDALWLEAKFHRFFASKRLKGEWFDLSSEDLAAVKTMRHHDRLLTHSRDFDETEWGDTEPIGNHAAALGKRGGLKGGPARAAMLTPEQRSEIARKGGLARAKKLSTSFPPPSSDLMPPRT